MVETIEQIAAYWAGLEMLWRIQSLPEYKYKEFINEDKIRGRVISSLMHDFEYDAAHTMEQKAYGWAGGLCAQYFIYLPKFRELVTEILQDMAKQEAWSE